MAEKVEDINLPNGIITRLIKEALPDGVNIAKDMKTAITKAASVFILHLTSASTIVATNNKRKTISGADVLKALKDIEMERFIPEMEQALELFKKSQKIKKDATAKKKQQKDEQNSSTANNSEAAPRPKFRVEEIIVNDDDDDDEYDDDDDDITEIID